MFEMDEFVCHTVALSEVPSANEQNRLGYLMKEVGERYFADDPSFMDKYFSPACAAPSTASVH